MAPVIMILSGIIGLVILVVDEDKEALESMRRPYSTYAVTKAYPGRHPDSKLEDLQRQYTSYSAVKAASSVSISDTEAGT